MNKEQLTLIEKNIITSFQNDDALTERFSRYIALKDLQLIFNFLKERSENMPFLAGKYHDFHAKSHSLPRRVGVGVWKNNTMAIFIECKSKRAEEGVKDTQFIRSGRSKVLKPAFALYMDHYDRCVVEFLYSAKVKDVYLIDSIKKSFAKEESSLMWKGLFSRSAYRNEVAAIGSSQGVDFFWHVEDGGESLGALIEKRSMILSKWLKNKQSFTNSWLDLMDQVANSDILHMDIKPDNILLSKKDDRFTLSLIDWPDTALNMTTYEEECDFSEDSVICALDTPLIPHKIHMIYALSSCCKEVLQFDKMGMYKYEKNHLDMILKRLTSIYQNVLIYVFGDYLLDDYAVLSEDQKKLLHNCFISDLKVHSSSVMKALVQFDEAKWCWFSEALVGVDKENAYSAVLNGRP